MDFGATFQELLHEFLLFLPRLIAALVLFVLSLLFSGAAARSVRKALQLRIRDLETLQLLSRLTRWGVIVVGTVVALDQVNFDVTSFVAGLGIAGITVGFALQDIARNFVAGIILLIRQPFDIGDVVEIGGNTGTVLEVTTRDTVIKTFDGELVIIPNIEVFGQPILNCSDLPHRRRAVSIGLGYGEDVGHALAVLGETIRNVEGVMEEPAPSIVLTALGDSALEMTVYFWVNQETHSLLEVHSAAVRAIKEAAEREGIDLPYPTQTVRLQGPWPTGTPVADA
jgi:small conductance mechanosensitive channel